MFTFLCVLCVIQSLCVLLLWVCASAYREEAAFWKREAREYRRNYQAALLTLTDVYQEAQANGIPSPSRN